MKSMCKHWGLHISTDTDRLEVILGSFWAVWRGLLMSLEPKLRSWRFPRYWWFNKQYHGGYQLICLISQPILIALRHDWYRLKGFFKSFLQPLRPWELLKNWWRYGWMKFVTLSKIAKSLFIFLFFFFSFGLTTYKKCGKSVTSQVSHSRIIWEVWENSTQTM